MLIAQISDLHYRPRGVRLFGFVDVHTAAERAVAWINAHKPAIDAVLVTGDLVNDGDENDYGALADVLSRLDMPYAVIVGNHDRRDLVANTFPAIGSANLADRYAWSRTFGELHVIGLDTLIPGSGAGELGADQLGWLDESLSAAADRPTLVALHHPPFPVGIGFMAPYGLHDQASLEAVIARHPHVEAVLAGHIHRVMHRRFGGTVAMVAPGVAHHVPLDLTAGTQARWIMEPAGCLLHQFVPGEGLLSHAAWFGDFGPEAPYHNDHRTVLA